MAIKKNKVEDLRFDQKVFRGFEPSDLKVGQVYFFKFAGEYFPRIILKIDSLRIAITSFCFIAGSVYSFQSDHVEYLFVLKE